MLPQSEYVKIYPTILERINKSSRKVIPSVIITDDPFYVRNGIKTIILGNGKLLSFPVINGLELKSLPSAQYYKDLYKPKHKK